MNKKLLWLFATILTCGAIFTFCENGMDYPVVQSNDSGPDEAHLTYLHIA